MISEKNEGEGKKDNNSIDDCDPKEIRNVSDDFVDDDDDDEINDLDINMDSMSEKNKVDSRKEPKLSPAEELILQIQAQVKNLNKKEEEGEGEEEGEEGAQTPTKKSPLFNPFTPPFNIILGPSDRVLTPGPQHPIDDPSQHNATEYLLKSLSDKVKDVERIEREAKSLEESIHVDGNLDDSLDEVEDDLDPDLIKRFSSLKKARKKIRREVRKLEDVSVGVSKNEINVHNITNMSPDRSRSSREFSMISQHDLSMERERIKDVAQSFEMYLEVMKENLRMERKIMAQNKEKSELGDQVNKLTEKHLRMQVKYEKEVGSFLLERNRWLNIHNNVLMMLLLLFSFAIIFFLIFP